VHEAGNVDNNNRGDGTTTAVTSASGAAPRDRGRAGRALALRRLRRLSLLSSEFRHFVSAVEAHVGGQVHGVASVGGCTAVAFSYST
jgi:hypothetical protein